MGWDVKPRARAGAPSAPRRAPRVGTGSGAYRLGRGSGYERRSGAGRAQMRKPAKTSRAMVELRRWAWSALQTGAPVTWQSDLIRSVKFFWPPPRRRASPSWIYALDRFEILQCCVALRSLSASRAREGSAEEPHSQARFLRTSTTVQYCCIVVWGNGPIARLWHTGWVHSQEIPRTRN
jgi:hypothetical protein